MEQGIEFLIGDILLVYTGWMDAWASLSSEEQEALAKREVRHCVGVEQGIDTIRWHWERGFAAVGSDAYVALLAGTDGQNGV